MLTLLTYPGGFNEPSLSPFCIKTMIQLDLAGAEWTPKYVLDPSKAPLGRLPVLQTPDQGDIPESGFIQSYLEGKGADFYPGAAARKRREGHALIRMIEEHLRVGLVRDRWLVDGSWSAMKTEAFGTMPAPLRWFVPDLARKQVRSGLKAQGFGRMNDTQLMQSLAPDLECLTDILWETPYLLGDTPSAPDTSAVPVLSMLANLPSDTALRRAVRSNETLMAYVERGRTGLYPKLES